MTVTGPFTRLNDDGICERCARGTHRLCKNPWCTCTISNAGRHSHTNRPPIPVDDTPPRTSGASMTATATVTPIGNAKKPKAPPTFGLTKVDQLPDLVKPATSLVARVTELLDGAELDGGAWYELITYSTSFGSGGAASRLNKTLTAYEFAARGAIVYVRAKP